MLKSFGKVHRMVHISSLYQRTLKKAVPKGSGLWCLNFIQIRSQRIFCQMSFSNVSESITFWSNIRLWYVQCLQFVCVLFLLCAPMPVCSLRLVAMSACWTRWEWRIVGVDVFLMPVWWGMYSMVFPICSSNQLKKLPPVGHCRDRTTIAVSRNVHRDLNWNIPSLSSLSSRAPGPANSHWAWISFLFSLI